MDFHFSELKLLSFLLLGLMFSCISSVRQSVIFEDRFGSLPQGPINRSASLNSLTPCYYVPGAIAKAGGWMVATSMRNESFQNAWNIEHAEGGAFLSQTFKNLNERYEPISQIIHPLIVAGDELWEDYSVEFTFSPEFVMDKCGLVFRFRDERNFYFYGMEGNTIMLKQIHQATAPRRPLEKILAVAPFNWEPGRKYRGNVSVRRDKIFAMVNDSVPLHARDTAYSNGRIGFLSDLPARFYSLETKILSSEQRQLNRRKIQRERVIRQNLESNPEMVIWKKLEINHWGRDINIKFGDLNGDGDKEFVFAGSGKRPEGSRSEITSMFAVNLVGEILWQFGHPDKDTGSFTEELPFQIHDLNGDGKREVIFISGNRLMILNGRSGKIEKHVQLPSEQPYEFILFADLSGAGRDNCILTGNHSNSIMALNDNLKVLWKTGTKSGSHPVVIDLDGDLKDEILYGYNTISSEGRIIRDVGGSIGDDCNGVAVSSVRGRDSLEIRFIYAAGDWGLLHFDTDGQLTRQHNIGHVARFSVANFELEERGPEIVASNSWGGHGVMEYFGADGSLIRKYHTNTPGTTCTPVNWKGDGEEFYILNANHAEGGLYSGRGEKQVAFPDDGHPDLCYAVLDFTGDERDEIAVWDSGNLWIYTQAHNMRSGKTYYPERIPLYNYSVNQMHTSYSD
ncbi:MAG: hypothetical protein JXR52_00580 [Bacteroidales bacterium]|nr:hypothetical protein [Bacteroidales bacterium]